MSIATPASVGRRRGALQCLALVVLLVTGCRADDLVSISAGEPSRHVELARGGVLEVMLRSVGPGEYSAAVSSGSVEFLDVSVVPPAVPAGVTQRFRFRGATRGTAMLTFTHSGQNATVRHTVAVR